MTQPVKENPYQALVTILTNANRLSVKAFNAKSPQNLIFIILNDTLHVVPYDLAVLWKVTDGNLSLLGVSGQSTYTTSSEIVLRWKKLLKDLPDLNKSKLLKTEDFPERQEEWKLVQEKAKASVQWLPIRTEGKETIGLWIEKWDDPTGATFSPDRMKVVQEFLVPGYAAAWNKICAGMSFSKLKSFFTKQRLSYLAAVLLAFGLFVRVPLRVVAPCEVVAKNPYIVTAPQDGIIAKVDVKPGQHVKVGDILYDYDPRVPLQELKIAQKELEMTQSEINRIVAAGVQEHEPLAELATLNIKKQKAELDLEFAKSRANELIGKSPRDGVALIDNPDEWQGRPVKLGEKILVISDPDKTKVRMWIPENDNIQIDMSKPLTVFLNPNPLQSYEVNLIFISHETVLSDKHIPSFIAEGNWTKAYPDIKLGVEGTAILYGEKVSLLYYIFRKPMATLRDFTGI